ncbi:hypothetical protein CISIN_1g034687mg [Citrus sinensis]|uniref:Uncharacterized protein n=1 Tax=Citrus sinensis TaxID=2711 RepID=A0A067DNE1_CITSI|nr:hypothetical protein CISIN_1g034687mg [Citrus sinensis]
MKKKNFLTNKELLSQNHSIMKCLRLFLVKNFLRYMVNNIHRKYRMFLTKIFHGIIHIEFYNLSIKLYSESPFIYIHFSPSSLKKMYS